MGTVLSQATKDIANVDNAYSKEKLHTVQTMLTNKVKVCSSTLKHRAMADKKLPIVAVVRSTTKYSVNVTSKASEKVGTVLASLFDGKYQEGLKDGLIVTLAEFVADVSLGEQELQEFSLVFSDNSLLRVDYMLYKYQFDSKALEDNCQNGFCYFAQVGVLDLEKVNPQIALYEMSKSVGTQKMDEVTKKLDSVGHFAVKLYNVLGRMKEANRGLELSGAKGTPTDGVDDQENKYDVDDDDDDDVAL